MKDVLMQLDKILQIKNPGLYARLGNPLSDEMIDKIWGNVKFSIPDEVRFLYKWKNGTKFQDDVPLGDFWLMPLNAFSDIESSILTYSAILDGRLGYNGIAGNLFPLFESGGGERTFIDINPASKSFSKLFFYTLSDPDVDVLNTYGDSLNAFILSIIRCYEDDIYYDDGDGFLNCNERKESQVFTKLNPGSEYWRFYNGIYS